MKTIIYNKENIKEEEINNIVKRAKIILINSNDEILLTKCNKNYYLIGGHVENNESDIETIKRETLEETGIVLNIESVTPILNISYYTKEYPTENQCTKFIANYYYMKSDLLPNLSKTNLTKEEEDGNFELQYIHIDKVIDILNNSLKNCTSNNAVKDTISALEEFIKIYKEDIK